MRCRLSVSCVGDPSPPALTDTFNVFRSSAYFSNPLWKTLNGHGEATFHRRLSDVSATLISGSPDETTSPTRYPPSARRTSAQRRRRLQGQMQVAVLDGRA
jgi:hypothetical protein